MKLPQKFVLARQKMVQKFTKKATDVVKKEVGKTVEQKLEVYTPLICAVVGLCLVGFEGRDVKTAPNIIVNIQNLNIERVYYKT